MCVCEVLCQLQCVDTVGSQKSSRTILGCSGLHSAPESVLLEWLFLPTCTVNSSTFLGEYKLVRVMEGRGCRQSAIYTRGSHFIQSK